MIAKFFAFMSSKKKCQIIHAIRRAKERYDINLRREDIKEIVKLIQNNDSQSLVKRSNRVTIHEITYLNKVFIVVYDSLRKNIASFLSLNYKERALELENIRLQNKENVKNKLEEFNENYLKEMEELDLPKPTG